MKHSIQNIQKHAVQRKMTISISTTKVQNTFYEALPNIVAEYMKEISKITGREYKPFTYYGAKDADRIVVAMGSVTEVFKRDD